MPRWTAAALPDLSGHAVLVTGGNGGIGLETARMLAGAGAAVTITSRERGRGTAAEAELRRSHPQAAVDVLALDLADLASVEDAARRFAERHDRLDVLVNNAGVMATPYRQTVDGFELQLGTNHLGHFALTGHLLPLLLAAPRPRVVTVSSGAHRMGRMNFADLQSERGYAKWAAYGQSKLANLLFTFELQRRADAAGVGLAAVAAHPGYAATNLQLRGPRMAGNRLLELGMRMGNRLVGQPARRGALPIVYAAAAPGVAAGDYLGPDGPLEMRGYPVRVRASAAARDPAVARRLWQVSEELTGVRYEALAA